MLTRCNQCGTWFRVRKEQLAVADGWVRCGRCGEIFLAESSLVDESGRREGLRSSNPQGLTDPNPTQKTTPVQMKPQQEFETILELHQGTQQDEPQLEERALGTELDKWPPFSELPRDEPSTATLGDDAPPVQAEMADPFPETALSVFEFEPGAKRTDTESEPTTLSVAPPGIAHPERTGSILWAIGSVLVAGLIVFEGLAISHLGRTPGITSLNPTLESPTTGVAPVSPAQIHILSAEVRKSRRAPGGLTIEGTLFNASIHGLAFPQLLVRFTNLDGRIISEGLFPPADYLPIQTHNPVIPPHGAVAFRLRVVDPGREAVGFSLRSCLPPRRDTTYCGSS